MNKRFGRSHFLIELIGRYKKAIEVNERYKKWCEENPDKHSWNYDGEIVPKAKVERLGIMIRQEMVKYERGRTL